MARLNTAAAFIKPNMPLGQSGTLTDQEAFDVAAYFTQQTPRISPVKTTTGRKAGSAKMHATSAVKQLAEYVALAATLSASAS